MSIDLSNKPGPIGVFDSGYGGLTVLRQIRRVLPQYDYLYLGDNARAPYGNRSFDVVHEFTLQAVTRLFERGCQLVIIACNTASAKALPTIQQEDLPRLDPDRRVLGVIRPTAEIIGELTKTRHVGIFATKGTIRSNSYPIEIKKLYPDIVVTGVSCPMWVPLIENGEINNAGCDYFVKKRIDGIMSLDRQIDAIILGCTHYPILLPTILKYAPENVRIIPQGIYVADSLKKYLDRHPEMDARCSKGGICHYLTTESVDEFQKSATIFMDNEDVEAEHISWD